jgi:hypothetical protein
VPRKEVARDWRRLHNEGLHDSYALPNLITVTNSRRIRLAGNIAHTGEMKNVYKVLHGKPEGRSLGRQT